MDIGVMLNNLERDRLRAFRVAADLGFRVVHTSALAEGWLTGPERSVYIDAARASGLTIASMFVGFDGQSYRDLPSIRATVGLVLPQWRAHRTEIALRYCELAVDLGAPSLSAHLGFLPDERDHPDHRGLVDAVRRICDRCGESNLTFHLETGQESAARLLDLLADIDRPNLGVNFDPANYLLYGTDEPLAALRQLAPRLGGVHCKDALRTRQPGTLGTEVPIGQGEVPFPEMLAELWACGYAGPLVIEREHGPTVGADVLAARDYLRGLMADAAR